MTDSDSKKTIERSKGSHALEEWLDIEEGTTEMERIRYDSPLKKSDRYDLKDQEIEEQAHDIFKEAMSGYQSLESLLSNIEPKYRARMAEVALGYLKTALDASNSKQSQKDSIEKLKLQKEKIDKGGSGGKTNIIGVGDRNDMLKMLKEMRDSENGVIDVSPDEADDTSEKDD